MRTRLIGAVALVIARLAKGEPAAVETLHDIELLLRRALGYEMPPAASAAP